MLQVKELNLEKIKTIYDTHMQEAFPQSELRPYKNIEMLTKQGYYVCFGLYENTELLAYAFFTKSTDRKYCLLDYYAVVDGLRGKGIGSAFFPLLKEKMQDMDGIIELLKDIKPEIVELLAYHKLGESKKEALGFGKTEFSVPSKAEMTALCDKFVKNGINAVYKG